MYFMTNISSEDTVLTKKAFALFTESCGVHIQYWHYDNGCFADNAFIMDCEQNKQHFTYCGVNAHFQNSIATQEISDIQEQAQK